MNNSIVLVVIVAGVFTLSPMLRRAYDTID